MGRGKVFKGNSKVSVALRLIELRYFPSIICPAVGGRSGFSIGRIHGCSGDELLVCMAMRSTTCAISSALKCVNNTRARVWQLTQPESIDFCSRVPGALISHSPLDSCAASFEVFVTWLSSKSSWVDCSATSTEVFGSSYPMARTLIAYFPACTLSRGKPYRPWASLTTQVVMVEPTFLAPTSTPSIGPSA